MMFNVTHFTDGSIFQEFKNIKVNNVTPYIDSFIYNIRCIEKCLNVFLDTKYIVVMNDLNG